MEADEQVQVATRMLAFLSPPLNGAATVAIVYDPANPSSASEARGIEQSLQTGSGGGRVTLKPRRVPVANLQSLSGSKVAFLTHELRERQPDIATLAERESILTVSSDKGCLAAGYCAVAISTAPRVEITVSRDVLRKSRLQFGAAFLMLVKEI